MADMSVRMIAITESEPAEHSRRDQTDAPSNYPESILIPCHGIGKASDFLERPGDNHGEDKNDDRRLARIHQWKHGRTFVVVLFQESSVAPQTAGSRRLRHKCC
jgi:hypothetical protein